MKQTRSWLATLKLIALCQKRKDSFSIKLRITTPNPTLPITAILEREEAVVFTHEVKFVVVIKLGKTHRMMRQLR